ncbi:MAG: hypothetical protein HN348_17645, partial [Proteobacteria bacterium]|nr:hypothetical protein [Pseudomonadota bacterium]
MIMFAAGLFSLVAQTILLRELYVASHGNELGTGLFFASWLFWIGVGSLLGRHQLQKQFLNASALPWMALAYLPAMILQYWAFQELHTIGGVDPSGIFPLQRLACCILFLNAPISLITGMLFPLAASAAPNSLSTPGPPAAAKLYA